MALKALDKATREELLASREKLLAEMAKVKIEYQLVCAMLGALKVSDK